MCDARDLHGGSCVWCLVVVDRYELAWAAGFFDGEGWANLARAASRGTGQPMARINQACPDGIPHVLTRLQAALGGLGRIGGPYREEGRIDLYRWEVSSRGDVELLHHLLAPWLGEVKLQQFAQALERHTASSRGATRSDEWQAWAAGLYDGEGSAYLLDHRSHVGYRIGEIAMTQCGTGIAPEVLRRLLLVAGVGHVNGPYVQNDANEDVYRWKVTAQGDLAPAIATLWPWLDNVKRAQASRVLDALALQPPLPRGRPDWGNRKTHCVNGHEYATARVRAYAPHGRGVPVRENHRCLQCLREYAREQRDKKRRSAADDDRRPISEHASNYLLK
jgi:hypothetical protein